MVRNRSDIDNSFRKSRIAKPRLNQSVMDLSSASLSLFNQTIDLGADLQRRTVSSNAHYKNTNNTTLSGHPTRTRSGKTTPRNSRNLVLENRQKFSSTPIKKLHQIQDESSELASNIVNHRSSSQHQAPSQPSLEAKGFSKNKNLFGFKHSNTSCSYHSNNLFKPTLASQNRSAATISSRNQNHSNLSASSSVLSSSHVKTRSKSSSMQAQNLAKNQISDSDFKDAKPRLSSSRPSSASSRKSSVSRNFSGISEISKTYNYSNKSTFSRPSSVQSNHSSNYSKNSGASHVNSNNKTKKSTTVSTLGQNHKMTASDKIMSTAYSIDRPTFSRNGTSDIIEGKLTLKTTREVRPGNSKEIGLENLEKSKKFIDRSGRSSANSNYVSSGGSRPGSSAQTRRNLSGVKSGVSSPKPRWR